MRTTLDIDEAALAAVRQLAEHRAQPLGRVVSDLIFQALQPDTRTVRKNGLPVFRAPPGARPFGLDDVHHAEDEE